MSTAADKRDAVTECLKAHGGLTRGEIVKLTGIPRPILSVIVNEMLAAGSVVVSQTLPTAGRGRPAEVLRLRPNTPQYVGIALQTRRSYLMATDATYQPLVSVQISDHYQVDSAQRVEEILQLARTEAPTLDLSYLQGAGLAVSGLLPNTDLISPTASAARAAQQAKAAISRLLRLPVVVEGTMRAAAVAETHSRPGLENCFYFRVSDGVGAAQIADGRLVSGAHSLAGEIGHVTVEPGGEKCFCGKRGCLETVCSVPALSRRLGVTGEYGVVQAWEDGSAQARQLMIEAVETVGQVIAQSALLTDPGAIIVAWTLVQQIPQLLQVLKDAVDRNMLPGLRGVVPLEAALLPEASAVPMGAVLLAARKV